MIQIIGSKKCKATGKAKRFFSDRGIPLQFHDLANYELTPGLLEKLARLLGEENLINREGTFFKKNGYQWREYKVIEEILEHPELLQTPIVRAGGKAVCGASPEGWKKLLETE